MSTDSSSAEERHRRVNLALSSLILDPNNFRLRDDPRSKRRGVVSADRLSDKKVQTDTLSMVWGERNEGIRDLLTSYRENGWIHVEPIHVRKIGDRAFLVIEGNRRVAALKYLQALYFTNGDFGNLDPAIFSAVPCLEYPQGDEKTDLLLMGLQHIGGKKPWAAINQAEMLVELRDKHGKSPDEICNSLGISKRDFNLSVRALALCRLYQKSDWGDQFNRDKYNLFREVLRTPKVREWIGWSDAEARPTHTAHADILYSLLSEESPPDDDETLGGEEMGLSAKGERRPPVLITAAHIKELGNLVEDAAAMEELESSRSIQSATQSSGAMARTFVDRALDRTGQEVSRIFSSMERLTEDDLRKVEALSDKLLGVLHARRRPSAEQGLVEGPWLCELKPDGALLRTLTVSTYRGHRGLQIDGLGRFNLLVGLNNAGKTSLLEAIQLLCQQTDARGILEVARRRLRQPDLPGGQRLVDLMPDQWSIGGRFGGEEARLDVQVSREGSGPDVDLAVFVAEAEIKASFAGRIQRARARFTVDRLPRIELTEGAARWVRPAVFSSPFAALPLLDMRRAYEAALAIKPQLIAFLREHTVPGLVAIDYVGDAFKVTVEGELAPFDLAAMGDGTQRVFHIGLLFAAAAGGVLLIDEFDNALHAGLQAQAAPLFVELARHFNVQVFCSTHSLESIDAWLQSDATAETVCFELYREGKDSRATRYAGPDLAQWRESLGLDPRWRS